MFIGLESFDKVLSFFTLVRKEFAGSLSSFELMDSVAIKSVQRNIGLKCPINDSLGFYVLIELSADNNFINPAIQEFLEKALTEEIIVDATVADQPSLVQVMNIYKKKNFNTMSKSILLFYLKILMFSFYIFF